jgi:hypothetical protein
MGWIIMGVDECGMEFRADQKTFSTSDAAYDRLDEAREDYPEARRIWVEELRDKDYYMQKHMASDEDWYYDD